MDSASAADSAPNVDNQPSNDDNQPRVQKRVPGAFIQFATIRKQGEFLWGFSGYLPLCVPRLLRSALFSLLCLTQYIQLHTFSFQNHMKSYTL